MYVLVLVLIMLNGQPHIEVAPFPDVEACHAAKPGVLAQVAQHNASAEPMKAVLMSLECLSLKKAPQGKSV